MHLCMYSVLDVAESLSKNKRIASGENIPKKTLWASNLQNLCPGSPSYDAFRRNIPN